MNNSQLYREAASRIERGWRRGKPNANNDGECASEAVIRAVSDGRCGMHQRCIPPPMALEIQDHLLATSPWYRCICLPSVQRIRRNRSIQEKICLWNDARWRRKRTVVRMFRTLADRLDAEERRAQQAADRAVLAQLGMELEGRWTAAKTVNEYELAIC